MEDDSRDCKSFTASTSIRFLVSPLLQKIVRVNCLVFHVLSGINLGSELRFAEMGGGGGGFVILISGQLAIVSTPASQI
jgi:hypothetical protein